MRQRIQKILSARGIASRRKAEEMLAAGQVRVNGATAALGDSADPELDEILVRGDPIPPCCKACVHHTLQAQRVCDNPF